MGEIITRFSRAARYWLRRNHNDLYDSSQLEEVMSLPIFGKCDRNRKTAITWGHFFAALAQLQNDTKKEAPYVCVMHAWQWEILFESAAIDALLVQHRNSQEKAINGLYVGSAGPVDIYTTTDMTANASGEMW